MARLVSGVVSAPQALAAIDFQIVKIVSTDSEGESQEGRTAFAAMTGFAYPGRQRSRGSRSSAERSAGPRSVQC